MNFLAHIYLSGENKLIQIGNFMADGIRGNNYLNFPKDIQKGIILHRAIDTFTDAHPIFRKSKHRLHEKYGHYSGVITDIFYDHFLVSYASFEGLSMIMFQMDHRTKNRVDMHLSINELKEFYTEFEEEFTDFFEELQIHCKEKLATL